MKTVQKDVKSIFDHLPARAGKIKPVRITAVLFFQDAKPEWDGAFTLGDFMKNMKEL